MDEYELVADEAVEADLYIWDNLGVSSVTRCCYFLISVLVSLLFLIIATYLIVIMRNLEVEAIEKSAKNSIDYEYKKTVT